MLCIPLTVLSEKEVINISHFSPYITIEKPYNCMSTFRGFGKVLTQKYFYPRNGKDLRVEICNVASLGHCSHTQQVWDLN